MILSLVFFSTLRNCHPNLIQAKIELYNFVFVSHASVMFHATTCFEVVLDLIHKKSNNVYCYFELQCMRNLVLQKQTRNGQIDVQLLLLTVGMI